MNPFDKQIKDAKRVLEEVKYLGFELELMAMLMEARISNFRVTK